MVTSASASGSGAAGSCGPSTTATARAVHLAHQDEPGRVEARARSASRRRLSSTAAGSSPTWSPRFSSSYGAVLAPPYRSVNA